MEVMITILRAASTINQTRGGSKHIRRMPEGEKRAHGHGFLARGHEPAGDEVDDDDVVGVNGVPEPKGVGDDGRGSEIAISIITPFKSTISLHLGKMEK